MEIVISLSTTKPVLLRTAIQMIMPRTTGKIISSLITVKGVIATSTIQIVVIGRTLDRFIRRRRISCSIPALPVTRKGKKPPDIPFGQFSIGDKAITQRQPEIGASDSDAGSSVVKFQRRGIAVGSSRLGIAGCLQQTGDSGDIPYCAAGELQLTDFACAGRKPVGQHQGIVHVIKGQDQMVLIFEKSYIGWFDFTIKSNHITTGSAGIIDGITTGTQPKGIYVRTIAAIKIIVTGPAIKHIITGAAQKDVVTGIPIHQVGAFPALQLVYAAAAV